MIPKIYGENLFSSLGLYGATRTMLFFRNKNAQPAQDINLAG